MKKILLVLWLLVFYCVSAYAQNEKPNSSTANKTTLLNASESNLESTFSISPNPGKLRLNIVLVSQHADSKLEVFDVLGKRIYVKALTRLKTIVDVSRWHTGMYLVKVSSDEGVETKRFVKR